MRKMNFIIGLFVILLGCSSGASNANEAMPITDGNVNQYIQKMSQSSKSIAVGDDEVDKLIKIYKQPLEDMGYDFDATILQSIKLLSNASLTQLTVHAGKILNYVLLGISRNPDSVVTKGFVKQDTKIKVLDYLKFKEVNPQTLQALQYVAECENKNNGLCTIEQYVQILLKNSFVIPPSYMRDRNAFNDLTVDMILSNKLNKKVFAFKSSFDKQVNYYEFGKYLVYQNGQKVNANGFIEGSRKPFKLGAKGKDLKDYNPWWLVP